MALHADLELPDTLAREMARCFLREGGSSQLEAGTDAFRVRRRVESTASTAGDRLVSLRRTVLDAAYKNGVPTAGIRVRPAPLYVNHESGTGQESLKSRIGSRRPNGQAASGT